MFATPSNQDSLQQVHEFNRMFLLHLQRQLRAGRACDDLPEPVRLQLRHAPAETITSIAVFPRALFDLKLDDREPVAQDPLASIEYVAQYSLGISILHCAWSLSRQSIYQARLLLGLSSRTIQRLRALQVSDLHLLAHTPGLVCCAFAGRDWIWNELFKETRPEARQHLALIALQPRVGREWPGRRAGRLSS